MGTLLSEIGETIERRSLFIKRGLGPHVKLLHRHNTAARIGIIVLEDLAVISKPPFTLENHSSPFITALALVYPTPKATTLQTQILKQSLESPNDLETVDVLQQDDLRFLNMFTWPIHLLHPDDSTILFFREGVP